MPWAAGQVKIVIFLVSIKFFPINANNFCDAGQVPILRYFEAWMNKKAHTILFLPSTIKQNKWLSLKNDLNPVGYICGSKDIKHSNLHQVSTLWPIFYKVITLIIYSLKTCVRHERLSKK